MGAVFGDSVVLMEYSGGKGHVGGKTWSNSARTVYRVPGNDEGDSEPGMYGD